MPSPLSQELFYEVHRGIQGSVGKGGYEGLGMHWSASRNTAEHFTHKYGMPESAVIHAQIPLSSVETDSKRLVERGYANFGGKDPLGEKEVPVKEGASVFVTGITRYKRRDRDDWALRKRTTRYAEPKEMKA